MSADMKTISLSVSEDDYEVYREAAKMLGRPIAQLIREAMVRYRVEELEAKPPRTELPVLAGHRPLGELPSRAELVDELFERGQ